MDLTEEQLAIILQACIDFTRQLLEQDGGFLPFGARVKPADEIEFVQFARESATEPLDDLYRRTAAVLADEGRRNEIVGAALVANVGLPGQPAGGFQTAAAIQIEAANFCRSIVLPYRLGVGTAAAVEFGKMEPQKAEPAVFVR